MDEVYRGYRIACKFVDGEWLAKIYHARGSLTPLRAQSCEDEGEAICLSRARSQIDRYLDYLGARF